jgi:O-antigen/teichoic acid export membrane protein
MILALAPVVLAYAYGMSVLRALQRFVMFNLARLMMPLLTLVAIASALFLFGGGLDGAVAGYGVGTALAVAGTLLIVFRLAPPRLRLDFGLLGETLRYGSKSYAQNLIGHLTYRLDIYLVAYFLSPREVAFYSIATSVAEVLWYIPDSVGTVLFPKLSATDGERVHHLTAEACRHTLLITLLGAGAILVAGIFGIPLLYGQNFRPAVQPFLLLVPGVAVMTLYKVLARNFSSRNRQQVSVLAASVGLLLNAGLDWLLIPRLGTAGAAIASTLGYSAAGLLLLLAFHRESGVGWLDTLWLRSTDLIRYWDFWQRAWIRLTEVRKERDGAGAL